MKKGFMLIIVLCCTVIAWGGPNAIPVVKNTTFADFKDGIPKDWNIKVYKGKYLLEEEAGGLKITLTVGGNVNLGQKIAGFDAKTTYKFSFSYRKGTSNPNSIPGLSVKVHPIKKGSAPASPIWIMTNHVASNEWQEVSTTFTMPEGTAIVVIGFIGAAKHADTEETIWIKDPKIVPEPAVITLDKN